MCDSKQIIGEREQNIIRGKALVGKASKKDVLNLFDVMDAMENLLDEMDLEDAFGTQGWRYRIGYE